MHETTNNGTHYLKGNDMPNHGHIPQNQGNQFQNQQYQQHQSDNLQYPKAKSAMAIAGLVLGIIALLTSFLPIINNLSFILAILGLIFAIVGMVGVVRGKKSGKGIAIAALIITILSCVIVLATQSMYSAAIDEVTDTSIDVTTEQNSSSNNGADATDATTSDYTIADEQLDSSNGYYAYITGTFSNNSSEELSYVSITYNLYDADGNIIGNAYANANNVGAGSSWKYEATSALDPDEVASFERGEVTAW